MPNDSRNWVPLRKAVAVVADAYHAEIKGDYCDARLQAIAALQRRLSTRFIRSRAVLYSLVEDNEETAQATFPTEMHSIFWILFRSADDVQVMLEDWVSGDFSYHIPATESRLGLSGFATGVEVTTEYWPIVGSVPHSLAGTQGKEPDCAGPFTEYLKRNDGKRPLPQAMLNQWWNDLSGELRELGQEDLLDLCRSAFSRYDITRERIRELTGPRKRGPKPLSGKTTA